MDRARAPTRRWAASPDSMQKFVDVGFVLKEIVIKEQHNCRSTSYWEGCERSFLMLAHEYIFVLEKPIVVS